MFEDDKSHVAQNKIIIIVVIIIIIIITVHSVFAKLENILQKAENEGYQQFLFSHNVSNSPATRIV